MLYRYQRLCLAAILVLTLISLPSVAQSSLSGSYKSFKILKGTGIIDMKTGTPKSLTDGPQIQLVPKNKNDIPVDIFADTVDFEWAEAKDGKTISLPKRIILTGHVRVENTLGILTSAKAVMDFHQNLITFSGKPVCTLRSNGQRVFGEEIIFDIKKSEIKISEMITDMSIQDKSAAKEEPLALLQESDIQDWTGFFKRLKAQQKETDANPGKQLYALLDADMQAGINNSRTETMVENKDTFLEALNAALKNPGLYDAASWEGVDISRATQKQLKEESLSAADQVLLNRQLLKAAYPAFILQ